MNDYTIMYENQYKLTLSTNCYRNCLTVHFMLLQPRRIVIKDLAGFQNLPGLIAV
jgi:hypothetical protein